ncbi:DNA mismatch repair protein MutS domain protein [Candidatus Moduliflexus flocculans]|uniref:DNA mismatch repair protein MutS domain protein n=1 Tax=Candidatus Moduliflexus flocculans TaxID=1499966 RepID=A0A081BS06_9BACT|nr:DNA mismatch repair protein MutS domain protein [Candidatus Moduliflexus flocculans]
MRYCVLINGNSIKVRQYASESDYSAEVEQTFEKFKQGAVKNYAVKFRSEAEMNHVEAQILDAVVRLYPDIFGHLDQYCEEHRDYVDEKIGAFDREIQFYLSYLEFIAVFKRAGLNFCYPRMSEDHKEIYNYDGFDLALANKLRLENAMVVCNDFFLNGQERIFIITGPNQGGKTTFARAFGQIHYLASLGCPVPGRDAQLFLFDRLFTHFEQEENLANLRGKLQDDLVRMREILKQATPNSIIIMNEVFTSTALKDAIFLIRKVMEQIMQLDALCACVTFLDELASLSETTVSMVSTIVPENPALRTYKVIRKHADGLAYAISIAEKYRLTYDALKERIVS